MERMESELCDGAARPDTPGWETVWTSSPQAWRAERRTLWWRWAAAAGWASSGKSAPPAGSSWAL